MNMLDLPDEILLHLINYLKGSDVAILMRVNKRLYGVAKDKQIQENILTEYLQNKNIVRCITHFDGPKPILNSMINKLSSQKEKEECLYYFVRTRDDIRCRKIMKEMTITDQILTKILKTNNMAMKKYISQRYTKEYSRILLGNLKI